MDDPERDLIAAAQVALQTKKLDFRDEPQDPVLNRSSQRWVSSVNHER